VEILVKRRILIIDGHPDSDSQRYVHALCKAYYDGACQAGHEVRSIIVSELQFPPLRNNDDFQFGKAPENIRKCQEELAWANHVILFFPLWLGSMPAMLKGFLEQLLRPGFAFSAAQDRGHHKKLLSGKSARIIVTMGMPALFYRWYFRAHSLKTLERNVLAFCGIHPVHACVVGSVEAIGPAGRGEWLEKMRKLGCRGR